MSNDRFHRSVTNINASDVKVTFQANGRAMVGLASALTQCGDTKTFIPGSSNVLESRNCTATVLSFVYAPAGQLNKMQSPTLIAINVNPAWNERNMQELQQQGQQIAANGQAMLAATQQQNQQHLTQIFNSWKQSSAAQQAQYDQHNQAMQQQSNAYHESNQAFAAHMGDYNDYTNTATGETYRASNQYSNTYADSTGTVMLQTNQAGSPGVDWSIMDPRFK